MSAGVNRDLVVGGVIAALLHAAALVALGAPTSREQIDAEPARSTVVVMTSAFDTRSVSNAEPDLDPHHVAPSPPRVDPLPPDIESAAVDRTDVAPLETPDDASFPERLATPELVTRPTEVEPRVEVPPPSALTTQLPTMETPTEPQTAQTIITEPIVATGGPVTAPRLTNYREPTYPETAERRGYEGTTTLRVHVLADGRVDAIEVATSSGHETLDRAARRAARRWRFEPATRDGRPIDRWVEIPVHFNIES